MFSEEFDNAFDDRNSRLRNFEGGKEVQEHPTRIASQPLTYFAPSIVSTPPPPPPPPTGKYKTRQAVNNPLYRQNGFQIAHEIPPKLIELLSRKPKPFSETTGTGYHGCVHSIEQSTFIDPEDSTQTVDGIGIYAINDTETVSYIQVPGFNLYGYLELPISWSQEQIDRFQHQVLNGCTSKYCKQCFEKRRSREALIRARGHYGVQDDECVDPQEEERTFFEYLQYRYKQDAVFKKEVDAEMTELQIPLTQAARNTVRFADSESTRTLNPLEEKMFRGRWSPKELLKFEVGRFSDTTIHRHRGRYVRFYVRHTSAINKINEYFSRKSIQRALLDFFYMPECIQQSHMGDPSTRFDNCPMDHYETCTKRRKIEKAGRMFDLETDPEEQPMSKRQARFLLECYEQLYGEGAERTQDRIWQQTLPVAQTNNEKININEKKRRYMPFRLHETNVKLVERFMVDLDLCALEWFDIRIESLREVTHIDNRVTWNKGWEVCCTDFRQIIPKPSKAEKPPLRKIAYDIEQFSSLFKSRGLFPDSKRIEDVCYLSSFVYWQVGTGNRDELKQYWTFSIMHNIHFKDEVDYEKRHARFYVDNYARHMDILQSLIFIIDHDEQTAYNNTGYDDNARALYAETCGLVAPDPKRAFLNERMPAPEHVAENNGQGCYGLMSRRKNHYCQCIFRKTESKQTGAFTQYRLSEAGRWIFDLLMDVRASHKLQEYGLNAVSENFIGKSKIDMKPGVQFQYYQYGMDPNATAEELEKNRLLILYCEQDCRLPMYLEEYFKIVAKYSGGSRANLLNMECQLWRGQQIRVWLNLLKEMRNSKCYDILFLAPYNARPEWEDNITTVGITATGRNREELVWDTRYDADIALDQLLGEDGMFQVGYQSTLERYGYDESEKVICRYARQIQFYENLCERVHMYPLETTSELQEYIRSTYSMYEEVPIKSVCEQLEHERMGTLVHSWTFRLKDLRKSFETSRALQRNIVDSGRVWLLIREAVERRDRINAYEAEHDIVFDFNRYALRVSNEDVYDPKKRTASIAQAAGDTAEAEEKANANKRRKVNAEQTVTGECFEDEEEPSSKALTNPIPEDEVDPDNPYANLLNQENISDDEDDEVPEEPAPLLPMASTTSSSSSASNALVTYQVIHESVADELKGATEGALIKRARLVSEGVTIDHALDCMKPYSLLKVEQKVKFKTRASKKKKVNYEGATVLEPRKGFHPMAHYTLDYNSLYPSAAVSRALSDETEVTAEEIEWYGYIEGDDYDTVLQMSACIGPSESDRSACRDQFSSVQYVYRS
jgi:hypothetical protein